MVAEVFGGFSALNAAINLAKTVKDIDDATRRNAVMIDLQRELLTAYQSQAALTERVSELEKEVTDLKKWNREKKKYELKAVDVGCLAYVSKAGAHPTEPTHWLCANCYADGKKSFLQHQGQTENFNHSIYGCARCSGRIMTATAHPGE